MPKPPKPDRPTKKVVSFPPHELVIRASVRDEDPPAPPGPIPLRAQPMPSTTKFTAIDVETANPDCASICQIGLVRFEDGTITDEWQTLVNPQDYFHPMNVRVHGISEAMTHGAPTWPELVEMVSGRLEGAVVVSHTAFDRLSVCRIYARYGFTAPTVMWLDSARVARRAWPEDCGLRGLGLKTLAELLSIPLTHHVAVEDAKAAGWVVCRAIAETGLGLDEWLTRVQHRTYSGADGIARAGNPDGALAGEVLVFTGALSMVRRAAAGMAATAGCDVDENVTGRTTLLVVGDQDIRYLAGHQKSSKHRKAELLMQSGQDIRILAEGDFLRLLALDSAHE